MTLIGRVATRRLDGPNSDGMVRACAVLFQIFIAEQGPTQALTI
jgi:hypothetical protein